MSRYGSGRIVVGIDSPYRNQPEVDSAIAQARRSHVGLTLLHVFVEPTAYGLGPWVPGMNDAVRDSKAALRQLAEALAQQNPDVDVESLVVVGFPADVLIRISRDARAIVLGCRGLGGFAELLLGSVSSQVASHAHCPVIVQRPADALTGDPEGPVLVGVDGSPANAAAIGFAFAEADLRHTRLIALHTWTLPLAAITDDYPSDVEREEQQARLLVSEALAGWREKFPDVVVDERVVHEPSAQDALIEASTTASLAVVGSRGRGGFTGLLLGSVSQALLHHGHCPVAVVRP